MPIKRYAERGFALTPLRPNTKIPYLDNWQSNPVSADWFDEHPDDNVGIILGAASGGSVDIDLDCSEARTLADSFLPDTDMQFGRSSAKGAHRFYLVDTPGPTKRFDGSHGTILEYRSDSAQTMVPPSRHPCGEQLVFENEAFSPARVDGDALMTSARALAAASLLLQHWQVGQRHHLTQAFAGGLAHAGWSGEDALLFIEAIARAAGDEELDDRLRAVIDTFERNAQRRSVKGWPTVADLIGEADARKIAKWLGITTPAARITRAAKSSPSEADHRWTDIGNAERFVEEHRHECFYHANAGAWYVWNGTCWTPSQTGEIQRMAHATARSIFEEAKKLPHAEQQEAWAWAKTSCSAPRIRAMLETSTSYLSVGTDQLDQQPFILNVANGSIDLRTSEIRPHDPSDYLTQITEITFDPEADCPRFRQFIQEVCGGDDELVRFVQDAMGYSLTGDTSAQCLFILHGPGANGKSTFMNVAIGLMGDYAVAIQADTLMQRQVSTGATPELARLDGKRVAMVSEGESNHKFAEALVKQVTGGDPITARHLYKEPFEFVPQFKLWMPTNKLPAIEGTEEAIWRRVHVIPFDVFIPPEKRDPWLSEKLQSEWPGILNWALAGCRRWRAQGLTPPQRVQLATSHYRESMDPVASFLAECTVRKPQAHVTKSDLFGAYQRWAMENDAEIFSKQAFGLRVKALGVDESRSNGTRYWKGILLME